MTLKTTNLSIILSCQLFLFMFGCTNSQTAASSGQIITPSATQTVTDNANVSPKITPTPTPVQVWIAPNLPQAFGETITLPVNFQITENQEKATLVIDVGDEQPISRWVFALAAPFPTTTDTVSSKDLLGIWLGNKQSAFSGHHLLVSKDTYEVFSKYWGTPSKSGVTQLPSSQLLKKAWDSKSTWAILPFEELVPQWKVIAVDGISPLRKGVDIQSYPLAIPISLSGDMQSGQTLMDSVSSGAENPAFPSNYDPNKLTTLVLTGTTALVRATAHFMETRGMTYPAMDILDWLTGADILHVSNEIPFTPKCPPPFSDQPELVFCSKPEYIQLLDFIGTDVVELSGDHFQDWGSEAVLYTIDLYNQRGWKYYGGGINLEEGRKPLLIENNGNKIAFIGCNGKDKGYAGASETSPGAVHCDFAYLDKEISRLKKENYLPVVTFQHLEYYSYKSHPALQTDFQNVAKAGAVIVSGSQAHQPQAFEFFNGALLHYGLGNLFFDQYKEGEPQRQAFIDRHIIYDNRHISTELLTMYFIDFARPRPMTEQERTDLLNTVFQASGWGIP